MSGSEHEKILNEMTAWIRRHPDDWIIDDTPELTDERMRELATSITANQGNPGRVRQRRRRRIIGGACIAVAIAGGSAAAAAILSGQPTAPNDGPACYDAASLESNAIVIGPGDDPIDGCSALWAAGDLGDGEVPPLSACIGPGGGIDVFPGDDACELLQLPKADMVLSPENQAVVDLQNRLVEEINAQPCIPVTEAASIATKLLAESDLLDGWTVSVAPGSASGDCGKVAVEPDHQQVVVNQL